MLNFEVFNTYGVSNTSLREFGTGGLVCGLTNNSNRSEEEQIIIFKDKKCCSGRLKEFWDQLDGKTPAVNIEEAGHEEEMNQDANDFIDFDKDLYIIVEKDS